MNNLFVFGDSYTQGHYKIEYENYEKYKKLRGGILFDLWSEILSKKLDLILYNFGHSGCGNDEIFSRVCNNIGLIQKNDILIINWTYITRFRWADNTWFKTIHGGPDPSIKESTRKEILLNKLNPIWRNLIYEYEKIIDRLAETIGFDVYYWSADNNLIYNLSEKNQRKYIGIEILPEYYKIIEKRLQEETGLFK